ncbi:MAG: putative transcriptional regulator, PucR family [Nocardioidaceae bacterium]|nr:putative transcriptional regulator, PucR family [Nocardioidaceae bacterium]
MGPLATATTARMDRDLAWYRELSAEDRSWIGLIAQNGIASFTTWFRDPQPVGTLAATVFGHAPRALTRVISLHQTVELVRTTIDAVEEDVDRLLGPDDGAVVRDAMLRYSRDIAFAAAEVYARAAEVRGAWDARLEALAVDAVLRGEADEAVRSRASALGWQASHGISVVLGRTPEGVDGGVDSGHTPDAYGAVDELRRSARQAGADTLCAVQGDRLVVVLGGVEDLDKAGVSIADHFGPGPVVMGPLVSDLLVAARSARAAAAGLRAAPGWPGAPRPVAADDLLPERALSGDGHARHQLVTAVYAPVASDGILLDTLEAYLEHGASIEGSARSLFVHANTIRYRLRRIEEVSGLSPAHPRDAYTLRVALTLGRLRGPEAG